MKWWLDVPPQATAKYWGCLIHRWEDIRDWKPALQRVPEALRPGAKRYLLDVSESTREWREAQGERSHPT